MSKTILIGIDGSDSSSKAIDFAIKKSRSTQSQLLIVYIIEWSPYTFNTPQENEVRHKRREEEISRAQAEILTPALNTLGAQGITAQSLIRHGKPAKALTQIAVEKKVSQIVIGRHGESNLSDLLFGSMASGLLQMSPVPVTVAP